MKKIFLSAVSLAALSGSAFAADLPSRKEAYVAPVVAPMWTGAYAGLNAGYNFGTNDNANAMQWGPYGPSFNGGGLLGGGIAGVLNGLSSNFLGAGVGAAGLAQSGTLSNSQSGFVGGAQIGYNYQWSNFVIGAEADIQGSGIRGTSKRAGGAAYGVGLGDNLLSKDDNLSYGNTAVGGTTVQSGVDWIGTVRGRIGYLAMPTMLVYGTAGLAYGNTWANVVSTAQDANTIAYSTPNALISGDHYAASATAYRTFTGGGSSNQISVGWTAGGGAEWMFMPNWSLKAEALYWNLGNQSVNTASYSGNTFGISSTGLGGNSLGWGAAYTNGRTNVNYQGVMARAGVNYHFNLGAAPVVAKF